MEKEKIERINELAHLAKERALTDEELSERDYIVTPDGKKHPLPRKKQ